MITTIFLLKGVLRRVEHEVLPHAAQVSTGSPFISPSALILSDVPINTQASENHSLPVTTRTIELAHAGIEVGAAVASQPAALRVNTITSSKLTIVVLELIFINFVLL